MSVQKNRSCTAVALIEAAQLLRFSEVSSLLHSVFSEQLFQYIFSEMALQAMDPSDILKQLAGGPEEGRPQTSPPPCSPCGRGSTPGTRTCHTAQGRVQVILLAHDITEEVEKFKFQTIFFNSPSFFFTNKTGPTQFSMVGLCCTENILPFHPSEVRILFI